MEMSNQALLIGYGIVLAVAGALLWYIINGSRRAKKRDSEQSYNWKPETDYDVIQTGEGPMTPPWPELRPRKSVGRDPKTKPSDSASS